MVSFEVEVTSRSDPFASVWNRLARCSTFR
jgi:hypothetical protein